MGISSEILPVNRIGQIVGVENDGSGNPSLINIITNSMLPRLLSLVSLTHHSETNVVSVNTNCQPEIGEDVAFFYKRYNALHPSAADKKPYLLIAGCATCRNICPASLSSIVPNQHLQQIHTKRNGLFASVNVEKIVVGPNGEVTLVPNNLFQL